MFLVASAPAPAKKAGSSEHLLIFDFSEIFDQFSIFQKFLRLFFLIFSNFLTNF